ncbi:anthrone oxygenase family protein, partial [Yinghuangia sp. YIM S09857]|uniref:anthrone oxygenase family protein n=1 Tax=Yinghuangia sp. YIM S09857 TaxID=3436929 RepID=UPI003F5374BE
GPIARWIVVALVLYTLSAFTTVAFSIPLNNDLDNAGAPSAIADPAAVREDFEDPWIAWNIVRTLLATAAVGAIAYAVLLRGRARALFTAGRA